jgi:hypothetical protein
MYQLEQANGELLSVSPHDTIKLISSEKTFAKWYWWLLALLLFWPALLVMIFLTTQEYIVSIQGTNYRVKKPDWVNLQNYMYNDLRSV